MPSLVSEKPQQHTISVGGKLSTLSTMAGKGKRKERAIMCRAALLSLISLSLFLSAGKYKHSSIDFLDEVLLYRREGQESRASS